MTKTANIVAATLLLGTVACNTDDATGPIESGEEATTAELTEERHGTVLAEYRSSESSGATIHAQFMDVTGISVDAAERALEVWSPPGELDIDACSIRAADFPTDTSQMTMRLLDVGPIQVAGPESRIELFGRSLPDFSTTVSGVVYGNEEGFELDRAELDYDPFGRYRFTATGADETGPFSVWLMAPDVPRLATVEESLVVDEELRLAWDASGTTNETELYLDVQRANAGPQASRLSCRLEDDGDFALPRAIFESLGDSDFDVALRRVHRVALDVEGLDGADFVFAATDERSAVLR